MPQTNVERATSYRNRLRKDPEKWQAQLQKEAAWRAKHRQTEKYKKQFQYHNAKRKFGITKDQYEELLKITECAICSQPATDIDHCHKTGKLRSRLCSGCNKGLGFFNDDIMKLRQAIKYLRKHANK